MTIFTRAPKIDPVLLAKRIKKVEKRVRRLKKLTRAYLFTDDLSDKQYNAWQRTIKEERMAVDELAELLRLQKKAKK